MKTYRRKATIRLPGYDYSQDGLYFVTSCVKGRICHFGKVVNAEMVLNQHGQIAHDQWAWLVNRYSYVSMHAFVVMPNHVHAVLEINRRLVSKSDQIIAQQTSNSGKTLVVGTGRPDASGSLQSTDDRQQPRFRKLYPWMRIDGQREAVKPTDQPIKIKPLDQLLGAYKTTTSKFIHLAGLPEFKWQRSYHDHIIRAEDSYDRIIAYIHSNPAKWREDRFYHD
jgi:putative transposase